MDEFELVALFAAQVSIALQNAEVHRAVEIRAQTDDLTGLLNHGTFQAWLRRSVEAREPFSLIMLDLDDFKSVNDAMGHQAGDRLLSEIAQAIVAAGRDSDHVFRYGGDEFALLLPGTDATSALAVAERVRTAVHDVGGAGSSWADAAMAVSVSIGLATFPRDGLTAESILLAADRACFVAKRKGPGLIATADEGLARAKEFSLQEPTPVDPPTHRRRLRRGCDVRVGAARRSRNLRGRHRQTRQTGSDARPNPRSAQRVPRPRRSALVPSAACVPEVGRPGPVSRRGSAAAVDAGPRRRPARHPSPSFVPPTPTPMPSFRAYEVVAGRHAALDRPDVRDDRPQHRLLEPRHLPEARPGVRGLQPEPDPGRLGAAPDPGRGRRPADAARPDPAPGVAGSRTPARSPSSRS